MTLVVDANVAVKWVVANPDTERADAVISSGEELIAPDLLVAEFANALWRYVRARDIILDQSHPIFERRGQDLVCALPVSVTQAILGADLEIPTLEGDGERIRIEPGTQSGTVVKLRGRGIPHIGRRARGDLYVTVAVEIPRELSKEERALFERAAELKGETRGKGQRRQGRLRKLLEK